LVDAPVAKDWAARLGRLALQLLVRRQRQEVDEALVQRDALEQPARLVGAAVLGEPVGTDLVADPLELLRLGLLAERTPARKRGYLAASRTPAVGQTPEP
jgi:hypothetical protein